jgi:hypothetical protein
VIDMTVIVRRISGHWTTPSDDRIREMKDWFERKGVTEEAVLDALDALIDDGVQYTPKTAQIAAKLKAQGAVKPTVLGIGDRGVIGRMKHDIVEERGGILEIIALLPQWTYRGRLRAEYEQAKARAEENKQFGLGGDDYWHDRLVAFEELLEEGEPT